MRPVRVGDLIARTTLGWLHAQCAIARQHEHEQDDEGE
jgi:hypothetical protein